jgi:Xaa-Pro aminopeptidase
MRVSRKLNNPHLAKLKALIKAQGLDAYLITDTIHGYYLSGFTGTNCWLLITAEAQNYFITDFRYREQARAEVTGFELVIQEQSAFQTLGQLIKQAGMKKIGVDQDELTLAVYTRLNEEITDGTLVPLPNPAKKIRRVKSAEELQLINKAVEIADKAFIHILDYLRPGITEKEVAFELEFFMRRLGGTRNAFETIVASGERAALPHGVASNKVMDAGEMVVLDFGTVYQGYHSDLTRTVFLGEPDARAEEIYRVVLEAQDRALKHIQPGMRSSEVDLLARQIISDAGYGDFFGHGLGHGVGLAIHEEPSLSPRDETILEPGMIVTVEPGIYLPGWGGIRIEDMVFLSPGGCEILTRSPKNFKLH